MALSVAPAAYRIIFSSSSEMAFFSAGLLAAAACCNGNCSFTSSRKQNQLCTEKKWDWALAQMYKI